MPFHFLPISPVTAGVALAVIAGVFWHRHGTAKTLVESELRRLHAKDIEINSDWFAGRRHQFTFDVTYTSHTGDRITNRCQVRQLVGEDSEVYWEEQLTPYKE